MAVAALASRKLRIGIAGSASVFNADPSMPSNNWTANDTPITSIFEIPNILRFYWGPNNKVETTRASMTKENALSIQKVVEGPNKSIVTLSIAMKRATGIAAIYACVFFIMTSVLRTRDRTSRFQRSDIHIRNRTLQHFAANWYPQGWAASRTCRWLVRVHRS